MGFQTDWIVTRELHALFRSGSEYKRVPTHAPSKQAKRLQEAGIRPALLRFLLLEGPTVPITRSSGTQKTRVEVP